MALRARATVALALGALAGGCHDTGPLAPIAPEPDEVDALVVCDDVTFGELKYLDAIDADCRARVEALGHAAPSNFAQRLILLGAAESAEGARTAYVIAADAEGRAVGAEALAGLRVEFIGADGGITELSADSLSLETLSAEDGELVAVAFANDYSNTMRDGDLDAVAELERALLATFPAGIEGSVTRFSTAVHVAAPRTDDRALLEAALAPDDTIVRERTALYDGMGAAIEALLESDRPIRLLVVATDGPDNAPSDTRRGEVAAAISANGIAGFVGGALFADATELRSMFGPRGVVLQARSMTDLPSLAAEYVTALGAITKVTIPSEHDGASRYRIVLDETGVVVR